MQCSRCGKQITAEQSFTQNDKKFCEDCYMEVMSAQEKTCDPWATYLSSRATKGKVEEGLTEMGKNIYEFIKGKGKATREEVMAKFKLSKDDLAPQLNVLMHADLVKDLSAGGAMYLIPIPVSPLK